MYARESNPYACPRRARSEPEYRRLPGRARLHVGYLLRNLSSVQQVDLPVRPLDQGVDLAKLPG